MSSSRDFENLHSRFAVLKVKSWKLLTSFTNRLCHHCRQPTVPLRARSVRALTYLGLTFLPLSCVTGLFSMNDSFLPGSAEGGRKFWIPLCLCRCVASGCFLAEFSDRKLAGVWIWL